MYMQGTGINKESKRHSHPYRESERKYVKSTGSHESHMYRYTIIFLELYAFLIPVLTSTLVLGIRRV